VTRSDWFSATGFCLFYETKAGGKRTAIELEVEESGLSLRYTAATTAHREDGQEAGVHPADGFTLSPRGYADDDPWFGKDANPEGRINVPDAAGEPAR
jgi:hypothetical protein